MKISTGIWIIVALAVIAGAAWLVARNRPPSPVPTAAIATATTTSENLLPDVYPLYPGVSWGSEQSTTYDQFSGYQITSVIEPDVTDLAGVFQPFEQYYAAKLSSAGWSVDNPLAAGGAGSSVAAYKKGDDEIIVSYNSLFNMGNPNAPAQCPCEITLQIFSGSDSLTPSVPGF